MDFQSHGAIYRLLFILVLELEVFMGKLHSHNCDGGDRLADLLGKGDEWMTLDELCRAAADLIEEQAAQIKTFELANFLNVTTSASRTGSHFPFSEELADPTSKHTKPHQPVV